MHFKDLSLATDDAKIVLGDLDLYNGSQEEAVDFDERMRRVEYLHDNANQFPAEIRDLLTEHRFLLENSDAIPERAETIVRSLMIQVAEISPDYNIDYLPGLDVITPLLEILGLPKYPSPISVEAIPEEDMNIRRREAALWRRWAATRGSAAAGFRREVRNSYRATCIVCGIQLPQSRFCRVPGVDSVHILPWATDSINFVSNGLCLCKIHHWTFDQQLIAIIFESSRYAVELTALAPEALGSEALIQLKSHTGQIPNSRLPQSPSEWPRPQFLGELYRLVGA